MEKFEEIARKRLRKPRGRKLISAVELADKINAEKEIDKFRKLEKVINNAFEEIFGVPQKDYKTKIKLLDKAVNKYNL